MAVDLHSMDLKLVREADGLAVDLLPLQGLWTETQYLKLTEQTTHLIEFTDGVIQARGAMAHLHPAAFLV